MLSIKVGHFHSPLSGERSSQIEVTGDVVRVDHHDVGGGDVGLTGFGQRDSGRLKVAAG